jgi:hypothetical protein
VTDPYGRILGFPDRIIIIIIIIIITFTWNKEQSFTIQEYSLWKKKLVSWKRFLSSHVEVIGSCILVCQLHDKKWVHKFLLANNSSFILPDISNMKNLRCGFIQEDNRRVVDQFKSNRQTFSLPAWQTFSPCVAAWYQPKSGKDFFNLDDRASREEIEDIYPK